MWCTDAALNDDEYLEAHPEKRAVVVIDNFLHRQDDTGDKIYQRLADWSALLVSANVAHGNLIKFAFYFNSTVYSNLFQYLVIFLTNDVSFSKQLAKSLPDRVCLIP